MELNLSVYHIFFLVFISYFFLLTVYYTVMAFIGLSESRKRAIESGIEDYALFSISRFSIPVSIIIPSRNEEKWISHCVNSVLNINYPEFEIIIVNDGSTDRTLDILKDLLQLKPILNPYVDRFDAGKIDGVFKSAAYPFVTVLSKAGGHKKAGACNTALNIARYKYICVLDSDTVLENDVFLKVMAHVQKDPENIIGAGCYFGLVNGFLLNKGKIVSRRFVSRPIIGYQNMEYIRSFIGNRLAWSRFNSMPIVSGGFAVWRRDIVLELGGFSENFSSEDLEFTFRAHDYIVKKKKPYKILMLPYCAGWTAGPTNIRALVKQRNRWQRVTNESVWKYRHMFLNPRFKYLGFVTFPYYLFYEVLGPFVETASVVVFIAAWAAGIADFTSMAVLFLLMMLSQTIISLLSILSFSRDQEFMKAGDTVYLVLLVFFEFFWYRWIISAAKISGTISFFRGIRTMDQFARTGGGEAYEKK